MAVIFITKKDGSRQKYRLPSEADSVVSIGRSDDCLISMPDVLGLSGRHCRIESKGSEYAIVDENSTNGTLCNGERIESRILRRGDVYRIGEASLVFDPETQNAPKIDLASVAEPVVQSAPTSDAVAENPAAAQRPAVSLPPRSEHESDPAAAEIILGNEVGPAASREPEPRKLRIPTGRKVSHRAPHGASSVSEPAYLRALILLYVVVMLGGAFYAGLTLRHWWVTGRFLPTDDGSVEAVEVAARPASAPTKAAASAVAPAPVSPAPVAPAPVAPSPDAEAVSSSTDPGAATVELDDDWLDGDDDDGALPSDNVTDDTEPDETDETDEGEAAAGPDAGAAATDEGSALLA